MSSIILFIEARRTSVSDVMLGPTESIFILTFSAAMLIAECVNSAAAPKSVIALALQLVASSISVIPSSSHPDRAVSIGTSAALM